MSSRTNVLRWTAASLLQRSECQRPSMQMEIWPISLVSVIFCHLSIRHTRMYIVPQRGQAPSAENALSPDEEAILSTRVIVTKTLAFTSFQVNPRSDEDVY